MASISTLGSLTEAISRRKGPLGPCQTGFGRVGPCPSNTGFWKGRGWERNDRLQGGAAAVKTSSGVRTPSTFRGWRLIRSSTARTWAGDLWTTGVKPWLAPVLAGEVGLETESDTEENGRASGSSLSGDSRSFPVRRNAFGADPRGDDPPGMGRMTVDRVATDRPGADPAEACWAGADGL